MTPREWYSKSISSNYSTASLSAAAHTVRPAGPIPERPNFDDDNNDEKPAGREPSDIRPISISDEMKTLLSRLRDERHRQPRAAGRARRAEAGAPAHPLRDARAGLDWNKTYVKSAAVVGDVHGQVPPARRPRDLRRAGAHGAGVLDARAADRRPGQLRLDRRRSAGAVALHRSRACAQDRDAFLLDDLDKDTVDFRANYDDSRAGAGRPARASSPICWSTASGGIAVGMATNIPPHNLGEVIDACMRPSRRSRDHHRGAAQIIQGPDFPTGGIIIGRAGGIAPAYRQGPRLDHHARARCKVEKSARTARRSIVTEIPYQVNKRALIEQIAELVRDKQIEGICRPAGRERPPGHAHRDRAEARRVRRCGAEPALALLRPADHFRRQHAGDQRRPPRAAEPQGLHRRVHRPSARRW